MDQKRHLLIIVTDNSIIHCFKFFSSSMIQQKMKYFFACYRTVLKAELLRWVGLKYLFCVLLQSTTMIKQTILAHQREKSKPLVSDILEARFFPSEEVSNDYQTYWKLHPLTEAKISTNFALLLLKNNNMTEIKVL